MIKKEEKKILKDIEKRYDLKSLNDELSFSFLDALSVKASSMEVEQIFLNKNNIDEDILYLSNVLISDL